MAQEGGGLPELIDALRWRWRLVLLVAIPLFVGAVAYAESLPALYDGVAIVSVAPESAEVPPDTVRVVAPKYVAYITAPATIRRVAPVAREDPGELEDVISASLATDTGNVTITVRLPSPERAVKAANAFARALETFSQRDELLDAEVIAPAALPREPAAPPRKLIEAAALLVGLLLGLVAAFAVERSRPRVRTWRDIAILTGYPVIGRLPKVRRLRKASPSRALAEPTVGAAVRTLRTNLERELGTQPRGVFLVTSPVAGDGKTTAATLLATALARLHVSVLLIDADLRRPEIGKGIGLTTEGGLAAVLRGRATLLESLAPGWNERLSVLPTSPDPDAGDLLARHFAAVLAEARNLFDVVVVDSPPLLGTDDTRTIATFADGVLLVVSAGTMANPVSEAVLALHTLRVRVLGAVANRARDSAGSAGSYVGVGS